MKCLIKTKKDNKLSIEKKVERLEKDVSTIKKQAERNKYAKLFQQSQKMQSNLVAIVGVAIAVVTLVVAIPGVFSFVTYEKKINELEAMINTQKYVSFAERIGSNEKKIEYYTAAIEYDKENPDLYYRRADVYFWNKDFEQALSDCKKAIKFDGGYLEAYLLRGKIYFEMEEYELAIDDFNNAFSLEHEDEINAYLACSYYYIQDSKTALKYLEKCAYEELEFIVKDKENDNLYFMKSNCFTQEKNYSDAASELSIYINKIVRNRGLESLELVTGQLINLLETKGDENSVKYISELNLKLYEEKQEKREQMRNNNGMPVENILSTDDELYRAVIEIIQKLENE